MKRAEENKATNKLYNIFNDIGRPQSVIDPRSNVDFSLPRQHMRKQRNYETFRTIKEVLNLAAHERTGSDTNRG